MPFSTHIRAVGVQLPDSDRAYIRKKLDMKLTKFAPSFERVTVRVTDVNGARGGRDQECRIKVVLRERPSIVVTRRHASRRVAIDGAVRATGRTVWRTTRRQKRR